MTAAMNTGKICRKKNIESKISSVYGPPVGEEEIAIHPLKICPLLFIV